MSEIKGAKKLTLEEGLQVISELSLEFAKFKEFYISQNNQKFDHPDELLTIEGAASLLHVSVDTIRTYVRKRQIPFSRKFKLLYFSRQELMAWVKEGRTLTEREKSAMLQEVAERVSTIMKQKPKSASKLFTRNSTV